jgi:hypothetical protein
MGMYEVINLCAARRRYWALRFLELDNLQSELLARSRDALKRSQELLVVSKPTSSLVCVDAVRQHHLVEPRRRP